MRATFATALVLSAWVLLGEAARTRHIKARVDDTEFASIGALVLTNAEELKKRTKLVDWSRTDAWIVFQTEGKTVVEWATTLDSAPGSALDPTKQASQGHAVTLDAFKEVLEQCGIRGFSCFGVFKFNYPSRKGQTTLKARSVLVMATDPIALKAKLGIMGGMTVIMATTAQVWPAFKFAINTKIPDLQTDNPDGLTAQSIWDRFPSNDKEEEECFIDYLEHMRDDGSHIEHGSGNDSGNSGIDDSGNGGDDGSDGKDDGDNGNDGPSRPDTGSTGSGGGTMDARETERLIQDAVKQAKAEMQNDIEDIATKTARTEVGLALRALGTGVGTKISEVGKMWQAKA